jgi:ubiquinone biosynthesis protein COQ4
LAQRGRRDVVLGPLPHEASELTGVRRIARRCSGRQTASRNRGVVALWRRRLGCSRSPIRRFPSEAEMTDHSMRFGPSSGSTGTPRLHREWGHGLRSLLRFLTAPSDLDNSFEAMFALAGPTVDREFQKFANHPVGRSMLDENPRRDLNALLMDREALAAMPEGSFAHAYLQYLGGDQMGSAEYFLDAARIDDKARRFGWSSDLVWFIQRMANSHDLFHVITGYDRNVTGEVGVIAYTAGQIPLLPLRLLLPYFVVLKPSQPIRWARFVREAYRHGRSSPSLACVDYEDLLPRPISEARRRIGLRALEVVHPAGIPAKGWLLDRIERNVALV